MCVGDVEHLLHLFLDCDFAKSCWRWTGLCYDMTLVENASEWLLDKLGTETSENLIKIAMVIWGVWWARNQRVWEGKVISPEVAMKWSSKQVVEWREAQKRRQNIFTQLSCPSVKQTNRWEAPRTGMLKLNVDASVFEGADSFTIGMVLRDSQGRFVCGKTMRFAGQIPVFEAELVGILEALIWSQEFTGQSIVVESDSLLSVQAINKNKLNHLEVGDLLAQCRSILSNRSDVSVVFIKKHANKVAHLLARLPCMLNSFIVFQSPPSNVLGTLLSDVLN